MLPTPDVRSSRRTRRGDSGPRRRLRTRAAPTRDSRTRRPPRATRRQHPRAKGHDRSPDLQPEATTRRSSRRPTLTRIREPRPRAQPRQRPESPPAGPVQPLAARAAPPMSLSRTRRDRQVLTRLELSTEALHGHVPVRSRWWSTALIASVLAYGFDV